VLVEESLLSVGQYLERHGVELELELIAGQEGVRRPIEVPEAHRPGLGLAGHLNKEGADKRMLVFGKAELEFIRELTPELRRSRLSALLTEYTPAIFIARRYRPPRELLALCRKQQIPLFRSSMRTSTLLSKITTLLAEEFAPTITRHGTLVEVFGVGVLLQGESAVGKSEAALGLIERGHRLIADDIVRVRKREPRSLEGFSVELTRHHMEIRGIGIINVASLYGAVCVGDSKRIDLVVQLESWNDDHFYDRVGLDDQFCDILDVKLPFHVLPLKPGRDVVLLLETIALRHRLMRMGFNAAKELNARLIATISRNHRA
jgi:HPr kinase/phosphorylase